ncbi:hypothetical protein RHMOL_Rhmol06G0170500 [Rhododendron molle]|uniref:Uncharacterized protein n=1 Tax=Rhododendron molle TaxID=49168 RepID=A0ACC0NDT3_RHOML|nr:hypothetical protein RHMOL_Rhmol06G0170500 [Rhododendron molle]
MAKPSLCLIISFAIITVFISSAHLNKAQPVMYQPVANLSTTGINKPTIYISSSDAFTGKPIRAKLITPVLSLSNTSQFISGFYCFPNEASCFFGIVVFDNRYDYEEATVIRDPQLVWSANRDRPVKVNATLKFIGSGDLILEDTDRDMVWSTNTGGKSVTSLEFNEIGNLVLFDRNKAVVWQSFDHPTDCLLIGQKLVLGQKLIARTSSYDFSRGLFSLSILEVFLVGYLEVNPPLVYYKSILVGFENFTSLKEAYVEFENGSFNDQIICHGSTAQFMRLEPDGRLKVYEWRAGELRTVADLLTSSIGHCGHPMACGRYGICSSKGQCNCFEESSNVTGHFKLISYEQPNLGCSLVTPLSCNYSQYHSLLELKNTGYFNLRYNDNQLDEKTGLEDCKSACLSNCSCKAALFYHENRIGRLKGCLLLFEVFSLINNERGSNNSVFLKVQNSPAKQSSPPIDFPQKKNQEVAQSSWDLSLGAFFGVCLLIGSCMIVFKMKREPEELDDEFSIDKVPGMPTRFSYNDLKTATNDFNKKLGEGGFGSVFQGTLSDGTEVAVKLLNGPKQSCSDVGGTPGYMAPEWLSSIITEKVDVYSFGVMVLEILCGRKNLDRSQPEEEMHLLGLFERKGEVGQLLDMVDKYIADMQLHGAEVAEMMKLAVWCLQSDYQRRPSMTVVVQALEGLVSVQDNLDYSFINAPARRTMADTGEDMDAVDDGTPLLESALSGPR